MVALIIAPDDYIAHALALTLQAVTDAQVLATFSVAEALSMLKFGRPDVVLATGWLSTDELVQLMADAGAQVPGALRIVVEAPAAACYALLGLGVDLVLVEGAPPSRLLEALAQRLRTLTAGVKPA